MSISDALRRFKRTGKRDKIFLATKFGFDLTTLSGVDGSPGYAKRALNRSLTRLGVDQVDLYYLHVSDLSSRLYWMLTALHQRADRNVPIEVCVKHINLSSKLTGVTPDHRRRHGSVRARWQDTVPGTV